MAKPYKVELFVLVLFNLDTHTLAPIDKKGQTDSILHELNYASPPKLNYASCPKYKWEIITDSKKGLFLKDGTYAVYELKNPSDLGWKYEPIAAYAGIYLHRLILRFDFKIEIDTEIFHVLKDLHEEAKGLTDLILRNILANCDVCGWTRHLKPTYPYFGHQLYLVSGKDNWHDSPPFSLATTTMSLEMVEIPTLKFWKLRSVPMLLMSAPMLLRLSAPSTMLFSEKWSPHKRPIVRPSTCRDLINGIYSYCLYQNMQNMQKHMKANMTLCLWEFDDLTNLWEHFLNTMGHSKDRIQISMTKFLVVSTVLLVVVSIVLLLVPTGPRISGEVDVSLRARSFPMVLHPSRRSTSLEALCPKRKISTPGSEPPLSKRKPSIAK